MIPREVFYERLEKHCKLCADWDGVCLRGHALQSPTGCPLRKFEPIQAADYDADNGRAEIPKGKPGGCCGGVRADAVPEATWSQVVVNFAQSMKQWEASGFATVNSQVHDQRYAVCKTCQQFSGYYCKLCKCIVYTKAKLASEYCPLGGW